jgi:hypothetical protein
MGGAFAMKPISVRALREATLFMVGAGAFLNEVFSREVERPFIIAACLALMGLPFVLRGEEQIQRAKGEDDGDAGVR